MDEKNKLMVNDTWRPPDYLLKQAAQDKESDEQIFNEVLLPRKRDNKIDNKKKVSAAPYGIAQKKLKKEKKEPQDPQSLADELGIQLRTESVEDEDSGCYEDVYFDDVKKIHDKYEKEKVVYGNNSAVTSLLQDVEKLHIGRHGVICSDIMSEVSISPKKLYDVNKGYNVGKLLGKGAVGSVYLVIDNVTKKEFVSKKINAKQFCKKEIEVMLNFKHNSICEFYGIIVDADLVTIFLSFCGKNLEELVLKEKIVYTEGQIIKFAEQALSALAYLHQFDIIHMDIKPQNICVKQESCQLYLTDFGSSLTPLTAFEFAGLTPEYLSPEICQNLINALYRRANKNCPYPAASKKPNGKNDVYAWGLTMCFAIEGTHTMVKFMPQTKKEFEQYRMIQLPNWIIANKDHLCTLVPNIVSNDLKSFIALLLNGDEEQRLSAEMAHCKIEELEQARIIRDLEAVQAIESKDETTSIKARLNEKIRTRMPKEHTPIPESARPVAPVEESSPNVPNFTFLM